MHIPDGYLSPETCAAMYAAMVPAWWLTGRRLATRLSSALIPFLSLGSALSFALMSFQLPVPGGTSAHGVGGTLFALAVGPEAAVVAVSVALAVQALFFGDGGVLAYGANAFSAAMAGPVAGWLAFRALRSLRIREELAGAAAGFVGINVTGLAASLQLGLQPLLFRSPDGRPLYNPFGLREVVPAMLFAHLLVAGPVEAALTGLGLRLLRAQSWAKPGAQAVPRHGLRWAAILVASLALLLPLSALAPAAWGEWTLAEVEQMVGYLPAGMARLWAPWPAPWPALETGLLPLLGAAPAALMGAAVGTALVAGSFSALLWLLFRHRSVT